MTEQADQETAWHAEFERLGELLVYDNVKQGAIYNDERKRQAAFRWLADQAAKRRGREVRRANKKPRRLATGRAKFLRGTEPGRVRSQITASGRAGQASARP